VCYMVVPVRLGRWREHSGGEAHPSGNKGGGGGAHQQGQSTVRWKGTVAQRSADDGVGPTVADDNPRVFLQLRTSEGV
jgi:hypothetical protein